MNRSLKIRFNKARKFALNGEIEAAIPILEAIADKAEESVNASLAEIYGFLFDWEKCLENAGKFVANPNATYAGNVFDDMIRLIGRAAYETQKWKTVKNICENAVKRINRESYQDWQKNRYCKILRNLENYAERGGKTPHELIEIFGVKSDFDKSTSEEKQIAYKNAVENIDLIRPDLKGKFEEKIRHKLALAILYQQFEEAMAIFIENENLQIWDFEFLIPVMKYLVRTGEREKARQVIKNNIKKWIPVDIVQIAPIALLFDEDLKTVMDAEFCLEVLRMPRGI